MVGAKTRFFTASSFGKQVASPNSIDGVFTGGVSTSSNNPKSSCSTLRLKSPQQIQGVSSRPATGWEMAGSQHPGSWYRLNNLKGAPEEWISTCKTCPVSLETSWIWAAAKGSRTATARPPRRLPTGGVHKSCHPCLWAAATATSKSQEYKLVSWQQTMWTFAVAASSSKAAPCLFQLRMLRLQKPRLDRHL